MGRGSNRVFTLTTSFTFKAPATSAVKETEQNNYRSDWTVEQCLDNLKEFRRAAANNEVNEFEIMRKLTDKHRPKTIVRKYADLLLAMDKQKLSIWINGVSYSPLDYVKGHWNERTQKDLINYIDSDKCLFSATKKKRLKQHLDLSYSQTIVHR